VKANKIENKERSFIMAEKNRGESRSKMIRKENRGK
jgi:hypothetical protein